MVREANSGPTHAALHPTAATLLACLTWLMDHSDALLCASRLLGGDLSARRTARLIEAAANQTTVSRLFLADLDWLHGLLTLRPVGDPDAIESAFFADIDPADPAIFEICSRAEELRTHIDAVRAEAEAIRAKRCA